MASKPARQVERRAPRATAKAVKAPEAPITRALKIGQAARLLGVEAYVLRFWETEFPALRPNHTASKHRLYKTEDVETLRLIKHLLYEEGFTIEGARKRMKELGLGRGQAAHPKTATSPAGPSSDATARQTLIDIRRDLESIYRLFKD